MEFDTEKFIFIIQQRPALWNCKSPDYFNRIEKQCQWEDVTNIYKREDMSMEEKKELGLFLQKKWRNIRDTFINDLKRKNASGSAANLKRRYVFYDQLLFLKHTVVGNATVFNTNESQSTEESLNIADSVNPLVETPPWKPKRYKRNNPSNDVGNQLVDILNKNLEMKTREVDADRTFFLSLVTDFKKVAYHMQLQTKSELIRVIKQAQLPVHGHASWNYMRYSTGYPSDRYHSRDYSRTVVVPTPSPVRANENMRHNSIASEESVDCNTQESEEYVELFNSASYNS